MAVRAKKVKSKVVAAKKAKPAAKKKVVAAKKAAPKKKTAAKKLSTNASTHLQAYKNLEKRLEDALEKLCCDVEKKNKKAIAKDRSDLMLLLGECNYMERECAKCMEKKPKRKTR
jgi:DNA-binding transcriptional MocR family regulator